jgi:hypothetical protein
MMRFAERTGLTSANPSRRYLWTDAFAVCNFLGLNTATGNCGLSPHFCGESSELPGGLFSDFATDLPQGSFRLMLHGNPSIARCLV